MPFLELRSDEGGRTGWDEIAARLALLVSEEGDRIVPETGVAALRDLEYGTGANNPLS